MIRTARNICPVCDAGDPTSLITACDCDTTPTQRAASVRAYTPSRCPICRASIIVWRRKGLGARLLRALAVANHVQTLHSSRVV